MQLQPASLLKRFQQKISQSRFHFKVFAANETRNLFFNKGDCPNCGEANHCDLIKENSNGLCWCFGKPIYNEQLTDALQNNPDRQCFCESCLSMPA